jgi:hypothetical protein
VNHDVLFSAKMCEPWSGKLSQGLTIIVYYTEPVVVNHNYYTESVVVKHFELCRESGCESWCAMISRCAGIMVCYSQPMVMNHDVQS